MGLYAAGGGAAFRAAVLPVQQDCQLEENRLSNRHRKRTAAGLPRAVRAIGTLNPAPMSLKAKIEAVIYASEEPVTLAQLVGLLGEEGQAELDALRSQQTLLALDESPEPEAEAEDQDALERGVSGRRAGSRRETVEPEATPEVAPAAEGSAADAEKKLAREAAAGNEGAGASAPRPLPLAA